MDITGTPRQIVAARHALADRVEEWKAESNPTNAPEEMEYALKVGLMSWIQNELVESAEVYVAR